LHFFRRQAANRPALQPAQLKPAELDPLQLADIAADRLEHPANLTVAAFRDHYLELTRAGFRNFGAPGHAVIEHHAALQVFDLVAAERRAAP
jgi:hypothetical protein